MTDLVKNLAQVQQRINAAVAASQAQRAPELLAVSKKQELSKIIELAEAGHRLFGESYVQEASAKMLELEAMALSFDLCWHFIGPVQSNKVKMIAALFDWIQSVDRAKVIDLLAKHRPDSKPPMQVLLQLKVGDEASKSGADEDTIEMLAAQVEALPNLQLRRLMCIPPPASDYDTQQGHFKQAQALSQRLQQKFPDMDTLSMGMSGDLEAAISCGSTMVRVGTDLFGARV